MYYVDERYKGLWTQQSSTSFQPGSWTTFILLGGNTTLMDITCQAKLYTKIVITNKLVFLYNFYKLILLEIIKVEKQIMDHKFFPHLMKICVDKV